MKEASLHMFRIFMKYFPQNLGNLRLWHGRVHIGQTGPAEKGSTSVQIAGTKGFQLPAVIR